MIDYGSEDDIAKLIAHKLGANPDITYNNIPGLVMRVLAMMAHRPADLNVIVKKVSNILASQGKINESHLSELSIADIEDETVHSEANERDALAMRSFMTKYQPINMARASKLVSRKYEGEKSLPDIHDTLMRFVKYLKLDGKFINNEIDETPVDTHALASAAAKSERDENLQRQRRQAEKMNKDKKIHQVASRNIRGDSITVAEASKHREIMNAHFKRAREALYGFPTATVDDSDHESSTTTLMSSGTPQSNVTESENDELAMQDDLVMTEEPANWETRHTLNTVLNIDGQSVNIEVGYAYTPDNDESPVAILDIKRQDNGQAVASDTLSAVDNYNIVSQCFHAFHDEPELPVTEGEGAAAHNLNTTVSTREEDDIDVVVNYAMAEDDDGGYVVVHSIKRVDDQTDITPEIDQHDLLIIEEKCYQDYMHWAQEENDQQQIDRHISSQSNESFDSNMAEDHSQGAHDLTTVVSTTDEDDIEVIVNYTVSEDDDGGYVVIQSMNRVDNGLDIMAEVEHAYISDVEEQCYQDYMLWAQGENDQQQIDRYIASRSNESANIGIIESEDDGETIDEAMNTKIRNSTLTLPIDDPDYDTDDVDVTVSYKFDGGNGHGGNDPDGMSVEIFKVVRDDTQEDITTSISTEQLEMLMRSCADAGDFDDRDPDAMREGDDDQAYLDKREGDYMADAGAGLTKGTYMSWGKKFNTYVFDNDDAANDFMEENSGWGVIGVDEAGKVHVAEMDDTGMDETVVVPRDEQRSLENEIEVGGIDGPKQQRAYIARMKALAGLK